MAKTSQHIPGPRPGNPPTMVAPSAANIHNRELGRGFIPQASGGKKRSIAPLDMDAGRR